MRRFLRLLKRVLLILAAPVVAALLFGFLSPYLQIADSISHFRLHLSVALLVLAVLLLLTKAWRAALACAVLVIIAVTSFIPLVVTGAVTAEAAGGREVRLFQLNAFEGNPKPQAVLVLIQRNDPDVITLQEVSARTKVILDALGERYPSRIVCKYRDVGDVAVLSRLPKEAGQSEGCIEREGLAWLRVLVDGKPVTFASVHLAWPYPQRQHEQLDALKPHLESLQAPIVIGGDFNATPWSHAMARVTEATSAYPVTGLRFTWGKPLTSGGKTFAVLPIDHVLLSQELAPVKVQTGRSVGSDHLPVLASFTVLPTLAQAATADR